MKRMRFAAVAAVLATTALLTSPANAVPSYSGFYAFGDSLIDRGNAQKAADFVDDLPFIKMKDPAPAKKGYYDGRFTNGYNFADLISLATTGDVPQTTFPYGFDIPGIGINLPFSPPSGNRINFGYGGAQSIQGSEDVPDLSDQVAAFSKLRDNVADPSALYLITIGGNDVRDLVPSKKRPTVGTEAALDLADSAAEIQEQVSRLVQIGARNILVTGTPDIGLLPRYTGTKDEADRRALATSYARQLDDMVEAIVAELLASTGAQLTFFSLFDFWEANRANPGAFALTNTTEACLDLRTPGPGVDCTGFLFFDDIHPTADMHRHLADAMLALLTTPPTASLASSTVTVDSVPEPAPFGLVAIMVFGMAALRRVAPRGRTGPSAPSTRRRAVTPKRQGSASNR